MKKIRLRQVIQLASILTMFSLSGCMNVAMTSAQAVYGNHGISNSLGDQNITILTSRAIYWNTTDFKGQHIGISTFNRIVVLTGQLPSKELHDKLTEVVDKVPGIKKAYNLTEVTNRTSSLSEISDAYITAIIKAKLVAANEIDPSQIKVITENGTVYLIGIVFPEQAEIATDIARETNGVQNVVRIFSYIHISNKV